MLRDSIKDNVEKKREFLEDIFDLAMEQSTGSRGKVSGALSPFRVDMTETDARYEIVAELPGFSKEEITVSYVEDSQLIIRAERSDVEDDTVRYIYKERRTGEFERAFRVEDIVKEEVSVSYENGLLHIVLPKDAKEENKTIFDIN
mgnify:CR=1 FL=1